MPSSKAGAQPESGRKFRWLVIGVVLVAALYTGGWFYGAGWVKDLLAQNLERSDRNVTLSCPGLDVRGYPFRIGVFCDRIGIDDRTAGASLSTGALRSAAQVYRPGHAIVELDGPAEIRASRGLSIGADWRLLRASFVANLSALDRASIAYDDLTGTAASGNGGLDARYAIHHGEMHVRQNGPALDVAASADGLSFEGAGTRLPAIDIATDLTFADAADWLSRRGPPRDFPLGTSGDLRRLSIDLGGGSIANLTGRFLFGDDGLLNGAFDLDVRGIDPWRDAIQTAFPETASTIGNIAETVRALSSDGKNATVKLTVTNGTVYLGLIPIAFIAPV